MKHFRYWFRWAAELSGVTLIVAAGLLLFNFIAGGYLPENDSIAIYVLSAGSWYLAFSGVFVVSITIAGFFQAYLPVLISMNCTRKEAVRGILVVQPSIAVFFLLVSYFLQNLVSKRAGYQPDYRIYLLTSGIALAAIAFCLITGAVMIRWGNIGVILAIITYMIVGGVFGATVAISGESIPGVLTDASLVPDFLLKAASVVLAGGVFLYLAAGALVSGIVRNMEAKV